MTTIVVTPWHNNEQVEKFLSAWDINTIPTYLLLQQDKSKQGCALTKNAGIERAIQLGADTIIVLDDDCYPSKEAATLEQLIELHNKALLPQPIELFETITQPQSRGTPYFNKSITMPVAASMGYWLNIGDYDAPSQLVYGATNPMRFSRTTIYGKYFALSGMNLAFHSHWYPYCKFIDIPRFDDIWSGFIWQKVAYTKGYCFNLNGPLVTHSRQSNIWLNLLQEAQHLELNETIWKNIHNHPNTDYQELIRYVPQISNSKHT